MLLINELFESVQGEGSFTGTPAVFLRLQGCPVGCPWCDTKHTWPAQAAEEREFGAILSKTADSAEFARVPLDLLTQTIQRYVSSHVVITGGEPALQNLYPLCHDLIVKRGKTVQIETSGCFEIDVPPEVFVTVSPKLNMPGGYPLIESTIQRADEVKFPVGKQAHVDSLVQAMTPYMPLARNPVLYLQPLSQSRQATAACIEIAAVMGCRISIQTHKYIGVR